MNIKPTVAEWGQYPNPLGIRRRLGAIRAFKEDGLGLQGSMGWAHFGFAAQDDTTEIGRKKGTRNTRNQVLASSTREGKGRVVNTC